MVRKLGEIPFDSNTSKYFRRDIEAPWFAYWLKDKGSKDFAEATVFQTGSNRWERYNSGLQIRQADAAVHRGERYAQLQRAAASGRGVRCIRFRPDAPGSFIEKDR